MQKPLNTQLPADLPENWQIDQDITPTGVDAGLTQQHGYNYQSKQINNAHKAINGLNDAFANAQENLENLITDTSIIDTDTIATIKVDNTKKRITFLTLVNAIKAKFNSVYAALVHTHGNLTNDGKIGSTGNQVIFTGSDGKLQAGTAPVAGGGTGASTAAGARTNLGLGTVAIENVVPVTKGGTGATDASTARGNLGITPANIGAAPTSHNHDAANINTGTLSADRLPTIPVTKGGTGVTDLNVNKLQRGNNPDPRWVIYLSPSGNDNNTGFSTDAAMKTIRAAVGKYGGLNRLHLTLAPGTYTDTATVEISGNVYVDITGASETAGAVVVAHPIIFQSTEAKVRRVTFDLTNSAETYPALTFRQSKYDIQECVFRGKANVHAGVNASLGSSGYIWKCTFQSGIRGGEIGSGASMTAIECSVASGYTVGFDVNGGMLISGGNTNNAATKFTMYNSAAIFNDGQLLNQAANTVATAEVIS